MESGRRQGGSSWTALRQDSCRQVHDSQGHGSHMDWLGFSFDFPKNPAARSAGSCIVELPWEDPSHCSSCFWAHGFCPAQQHSLAGFLHQPVLRVSPPGQLNQHEPGFAMNPGSRLRDAHRRAVADSRAGSTTLPSCPQVPRKRGICKPIEEIERT